MAGRTFTGLGKQSGMVSGDYNSTRKATPQLTSGFGGMGTVAVRPQLPTEADGLEALRRNAAGRQGLTSTPDGLGTVVARPQNSGTGTTLSGGGYNLDSGGNVYQSSITPSPVYNNQDMAGEYNRQVAAGKQSQLSAMRPMGGNGFGVGSGALQYAGAAKGATALEGALSNAETTRLQDKTANAQSLLSGQQARFNDMLGQASADTLLSNIWNQYQNANNNQTLGLLGSLLGM